MRLTERKVIATLRQHGYKLTPQRRVVIQAIASNQEPITPIAIYEKVYQDQPNIGLVTVYRTLEILAELQLSCELHACGFCHSYTLGTPQQHHHLICSSCGIVIDFTNQDLSELEQSLSKENEFRIDGHLLELFGLCKTCQKAL